MPIWLRNYTFKSIQDFFDKQKEAEEKAMNKMKGVETATPQNTKVYKPDIKTPTYSTKASAK
jgi:hypothetical protein